MQQINFYRQRVAINVLAKDIANAKAIYEAAEGHAVIGVLSAQFATVEEGVPEVKRWMAEVPSISVGLGAGDPAQYYKAAMIAAHTHPAHVNQTFTGSGFAAVGAGAGNEERVDALVAAGVDVLLIDSSHGHSEGVLQRIRETRAKYPDLQIIGGNVATGAGARALAEAGCSAVKVGIGPGSICTTRIVTGVGVPQITAVSDAVEALEGTGIPVIADGGIRFSGDIAKAIAAGASAVMVGSMLAGTEESPGEIELYQGRSYKSYRGMGSLGAMSKGSSDRYFQSDNAADKLVPEGIEGRVAYKGRLKEIIHQQMGGLRSCMGLTGCATIDELRTKAEFVRISGAGIQESHVHDVTITKESPNYRLGS